jgi:hypothetical protein
VDEWLRGQAAGGYVTCDPAADRYLLSEEQAFALADDGTFLLVEPAAGEQVTDNLNPVGRIFYSASLFICVPNARSQGGPGLGSQVPEATWREVLTQAGFGRVRRAIETPFNRVFEARP